MQMLEGEIPGLVPVDVEGDKEARGNAAAPYVRFGCVLAASGVLFVDERLTCRGSGVSE